METVTGPARSGHDAYGADTHRPQLLHPGACGLPGIVCRAFYGSGHCVAGRVRSGCWIRPVNFRTPTDPTGWDHEILKAC